MLDFHSTYLHCALLHKILACYSEPDTRVHFYFAARVASATETSFVSSALIYQEALYLGWAYIVHSSSVNSTSEPSHGYDVQSFLYALSKEVLCGFAGVLFVSEMG